MANVNWASTVPSGVLKNRSLSTKVRREALARCEVQPFAKAEPGYGKGKGESHTLARVLQITESDADLANESDTIDEENFVIEKVDVTVNEYAKAVPFTNFAKQLLAFDLDATVREQLADLLKVTLDTKAATAFKSTPLKATLTGASTIVFEDTTPTNPAAANLGVFHIGKIASRLYNVQKAPYMNDSYVGVVNFAAYEGVMDDDTFMEWAKYTSPEKMYNNEVGRVRKVRLIATNHDSALTTLGDGSGEGIFFGEDACVFVEALPPEIRVRKDDAGFGRDPAIAFYGIGAWATPWDSFGLARVVHVTEASA